MIGGACSGAFRAPPVHPILVCMRVSLLALGLLWAATGCDRIARRLGASSDTSRAPSPALAPSPAPPPSPRPSSGCDAAPRGPFHLRPQAEAAAAGPELAAGTRLVVLARAGLGRRRGELFHVRVRDTGATGYAFLTLADLGAGCPFAWDEPAPPTRSETADGCLARRGWFATRAETLTDAARTLTATVAWRADVNGDGGDDELAHYDTVEGCMGEGVMGLFLHGPRGWRAVELGADTTGEHHGRDVTRVETPRGPLLLITDTEQFGDGDDGTRSAHYALHRVTPEGELVDVWRATNAGLTPEDWSFAAGPADTVVLTSRGANRTQTLAWDAARASLATR